jgi:hypothetical protein
MTGIDIAMHVVPWILTIISLSFSFYVIVHNKQKDEKQEAKACTIETTTVITKLELIQSAVNRTNDIISTIQNEIKGLEHRLTVVETMVKENNL